jgi:hypothetical protein
MAAMPKQRPSLVILDDRGRLRMPGGMKALSFTAS